MDFQPRPKQIDLLAEPLSDAEVRTLLERLGSREFGGPEDATLGSVVEATGSDAATVGRLLAEIRKEDFEERFGLQLKDHGRRIDTLEKKSSVKSPSKPSSSFQPDYYQQVALDRMAREERQREATAPFAIVVVAVTLLILLTFFLASGQKSSSSIPPFESEWRYSLDLKDGTVFLESNGDSWVNTKSGGRRKPTEEELMLVRAAASQKNKR